MTSDRHALGGGLGGGLDEIRLVLGYTVIILRPRSAVTKLVDILMLL